jgi:hypothetical protein
VVGKLLLGEVDGCPCHPGAWELYLVIIGHSKYNVYQSHTHCIQF